MGRYAVLFDKEGVGKKSIKRQNLVPTSPGEAELKTILTSDPASLRKMADLVNKNKLCFSTLGDAGLRALVRKLVDSGYWMKDTASEEQLLSNVTLAEHPRAADAIKILKRIESTKHSETELEQISTLIKADPGFLYIFSQLREHGMQFE